MPYKFFLLITSCWILGCASLSARGVVVMKVSDTEAHVDLGGAELQGVRGVSVYRPTCPPVVLLGKSKAADRAVCEKRLLGNGKVTEVMNDEYSLVTFPQAIAFEEGDIVEAYR